MAVTPLSSEQARPCGAKPAATVAAGCPCHLFTCCFFKQQILFFQNATLWCTPSIWGSEAQEAWRARQRGEKAG